MTTSTIPGTNNSAAMADFVFGGIEADEQRFLETERRLRSGVRHYHAIDPLDPSPGQPVNLTVTVGPQVAADHVTAYVTTDGSEPEGLRGQAVNGAAFPLKRVEIVWEPLLWAYVERWSVQLPGLPEGTFVRYTIEAWSAADSTLSEWSCERSIDGHDDERTLYGYGVDHLYVPAWAHEAVVYHIFVDRFRNPTLSDEQHAELDPEDLYQFWGGNLIGITERLDWITQLGATVIWLSPIFVTPSYHGYDTTDYYRIDPRFGTEDDLLKLVRQAHSRGIRVILDLVVNHTSVDFEPFARAVANVDDPARSWYSFGDKYKHGYRAFFDVAAMPQLNLDHPEARRYMVDAACHWLRVADIDGYRLDYAAGPSHAFWSWFRRECRSVKPNCWLFGEVTRAGYGLRTYTGRLDGCLDFAFARAVRQLCLRPDASIAEFAAWMERHLAYFGPDFSLPAFLDNHDMNRFLWVVGNSSRKLKFAASLLFGLGGTPVIYYGTEVGLSQPRGKASRYEESRHPMAWGERQDADVLEFFIRWIAARKAHDSLVYGGINTLHLDPEREVWVVQRTWNQDTVLLVVNAGEVVQAVALPVGTYADLDGVVHQDSVELEPWSVLLLAASQI